MSLKALTAINIRLTPGYDGKDAFDVIGALQPGDQVDPLEGPLVVDGLPWVRMARGWVAMVGTDGGIMLVAVNDKIQLCRPVDEHLPISQAFGENPEFYSKIKGYPVPLRGHNGLDFAGAVGSSVYATESGVVVRSEFDNTGFGNLIKIRHNWGESIYAHLSERIVYVGQAVVRGQKIGGMGDTGLSFGCHLHFGVRITPFDLADGWGGFSDPKGFFNVFD